MRELNDVFVESVKHLAAKAADFICDHQGKVLPDEVHAKSLNSLVSFVDTGSEKILVEGLSKLLPGSGFITEESTTQQGQQEYTWIIDPLDGTTNFLYDIPSFAVSIALMHQRQIVFGLVYEVNRRECFTAQKGKGAFLNGTKIQVSTRGVTDSLIATGFPYYDFSKTEKYMEVLKELMQHTTGIRRLGAAAVDLAYVACGRFDAFYEYSLYPWDVAAGALLVSEAGGSVSDFWGKEDWLFGKTIIAGNSQTHPYLRTLLSEKFY